jgi:hypothetical protein
MLSIGIAYQAIFKPLITLLLIALATAMLASSCSPAVQGSSGTSDAAGISATAAAEATQIVAEAQATALVLQARAQASALVKPPSGIEEQGGSPAPENRGLATPTATAAAASPAPTTMTDQFQVLSVKVDTETGLIAVKYAAPPDKARALYEGIVYVVDEKDGTKYRQIPVAGTLGPLLGKPVRPGQSSYIMFVNSEPVLLPGAMVTVVLGNFQQEHIQVQ